MAPLIEAAEAALASAAPKEFAVIIDRLFAFGRAFNVRVDDVAVQTRIYWDVLKSHPADLVAAAVNSAQASWTWGNRLPLPGDLVGMVREEFSRRATVARKLCMANARLARPGPATSPGQRTEAAYAYAAARLCAFPQAWRDGWHDGAWKYLFQRALDDMRAGQRPSVSTEDIEKRIKGWTEEGALRKAEMDKNFTERKSRTKRLAALHDKPIHVPSPEVAAAIAEARAEERRKAKGETT